MSLRVLVSPNALTELKGLLVGEKGLSIELINSAEQKIGVEFDAALISRDVTATSTKQKIIPSTQAFYDLLLNSRDLRWVQIHSAGADRQIYLDLMARGVTISGSSGVNAPIVMQNAIAGILMLARKFPLMLKAQAERRWDPLIKYPLPPDLAGQTAVIIGRGPIGGGIAKVLEAIGVKTISVGFNAALKDGKSAQDGVNHISELNQLLPQAQWLVIACPLSNETRGIINKDSIKLLPDGAHVINIARGEIIVEPDLIDALKNQKLAGAYLDVFASEPLDAGSPLWGMENVIVTPHSAGHSAGNEMRVLELFVENLRLFADGKKLKNQIAS
ncbi:NAD(P)-dependent oxidoreductase [Polynucleobacter sp. MWH-Aus1W21]|uniref:NAD(P)-dependent oxidoreductase n=1 Tax=Polynucleobacter sp. MWH-Aus1W21 TaxID=1855880 RepID=UPI001BFD12AA|nr:NAD(P)-dependent oxidoreductase [Polynucleobacter sp. MWH-Aus1W21]QWD66897.1 D-2-hydroxyacid dehydrogenase [Polynucleobacter sp. MWH-Aus1W21]